MAYNGSTILRIAETIQPGTDVTEEQDKLLSHYGIKLETYEGRSDEVKSKLVRIAKKTMRKRGK